MIQIINQTLYSMIMKNLRLLPLALLMFIAEVTIAKTVDKEMACQVATTFLSNNGARTTGLRDVTATTGFSNVYVFTTEDSFVLMAADDRVQPILGYSLTSRFELENMPANKRAWIQAYCEEIQYAIKHQTKASAEVVQQWRDLSEGILNLSREVTVVAPLIQTRWNQNSPYNLLCPSGSVTGCLATAMAQVMKYWNYPEHGIGMHSYVHSNYGELSADFQSTTYDWEHMINTYSDYNPSITETEKMAVATLMYHCGVSVNMDYSPHGSGAISYAAAYALKNYFNYSSETQLLYRSSYSDEEWINMLKADLNQNRPILYCGSGSGGGHAFICDGYNNDDYFHFNWGWNGYCDEYYTVDNLAPGPGGIGSGYLGEFNESQNAIFNAYPAPESAAEAPVLTANLITEYGVRNAQLNWTEVDNAVSYNVYRNGVLIHTTASGSETSFLHVHIDYGTSNYYVRSMDENGILSWPSEYASVTILFPAPTNLIAEQVDGGVQLSWQPCEGAEAYNVYCNNDIVGVGVDQASFNDNRTIAGELRYFVRGVDELGDESETSNIIILTIPYVMPVVDDLAASVSGNTVELSWSAPDWCYPETPSDTLTYGNDVFNGSSGYNHYHTYWGHRYPAEDLGAYSNMAFYRVSFYVRITGAYKLLVYEGTTNGHPQTQIREQYIWAESDGWNDIELQEKVIIDSSHDYWVFFSDVVDSTFPASFCYCSSDNGSYGSWQDPTQGVVKNNGRTYLIHTYLTDGVYTYNLYRNDSVVASNVSGTSYSDESLTEGTYTYYVKTNYYGGETVASNQVTVGIGNSTITQTTELAVGWNWFSTHLDITLDDLKAALVEALPNAAITIQSQTQNTTYNPNNNRWSGRLTSLDVTQMYMITVPIACEITLEGMPLNPSEHPITITNGANWMAYPLSESMTLSDAFAGFSLTGDVIQSQTQNANYGNGRWMGQLTTLEPGQGYIYKSSVQGDRTFIFSTGAKKSSVSKSKQIVL